MHGCVEPTNTAFLALDVMTENTEGAEFFTTSLPLLGTHVDLVIVYRAGKVIIEASKSLELPMAKETFESLPVKREGGREGGDGSSGRSRSVGALHEPSGIGHHVCLVKLHRDLIDLFPRYARLTRP